VLVTHTKELGQILAAVHQTSTNLGRTASIPTAIAIAQLALKHRQNKTLRQRVIVFVGSPLEDASPDAERALVRLAKKLKKNNVALDVIAFGDGIEEAGEGGHSVLRTFVETASSSDNSCVIPAFFSRFLRTNVPFLFVFSLARHYLAVPPGPHLLSSVILNSPILASDRGVPDELAAVPGAVGAPSGGGTSQFEFGVDPSLDPELAMVRFSHSFLVTKNKKKRTQKQALRMSMEEEAARQAAANPPPPAPDAAAPAATGPDGASAQPAAQPAAPVTDENEEALLQQALAMSEGTGAPPDVEMNEEHGGGDEDLTEEEMIARAIEMSMHPEPEQEEKKK